MKRAFIVHGWDGHPDEQWFPWLKSELEKIGFAVAVPQMPHTETPTIDEWVPFLAEQVGSPDGETLFVGHSIGVQTIFRYLQTLDQSVGGVISVAGFITLRPESLENEEVKGIAEPWLNTPIDFEKVKDMAGKIIAIFSDNDRYVPLENADVFRNRLDAKTIILKGKGHLGASDQAPELPEILESVAELLTRV